MGWHQAGYVGMAAMYDLQTLIVHLSRTLNHSPPALPRSRGSNHPPARDMCGRRHAGRSEPIGKSGSLCGSLDQETTRIVRRVWYNDGGFQGPCPEAVFTAPTIDELRCSGE